jgi:hypothetical protein
VTQFAAAAVIFLASAFTLIPREIWTIRSDDVVTGGHSAAAGLEADELASAGGLPGGVSGVTAGVTAGATASARAGADLG